MKRTLLAVVGALIPLAASGTPWITEPEGCLVVSAKEGASVASRWSGVCAAGKASGNGVLMASDGTFLSGEFRDGKPYNAFGREPMVNYGGQRSIIVATYTNGSVNYTSLGMPQGVTPTANARMLGKWRWSTNGGQCPEVHAYAASGHAAMASAEERIEKYFSLFSTGEDGAYLMLATAVGSNGKPDCQNKISKIDVHFSHLVYLRFDTADSYRTCASRDEKSCYGRATRDSGPR